MSNDANGPSEGASRGRRQLLQTLGAAGILGLAGCTGDDEDDTDDSADGDPGDEDPGDDDPGDEDPGDDEPEPEAVFEVSDLDPTEVEIDEGGSFDVSAVVSNTGDAEGTQDIEVQISGEAVASQSVTLDAGDETDVTFEAVDTSGVAPNEHTFGIYSEDDEATGTLNIIASTDVLHHWPMDEGEGDTVTDVVGGEDGTIRDLDWIEDSWTGGYALENEANGVVELSTLGSFGEDLNRDFAIVYTIESDHFDEDDNNAEGVMSSRDEAKGFAVLYNNWFFEIEQTVGLTIHDGNGESAVTAEEDGLLAGGRHRVVINKITNDAENWEIFIDGEEVASQVGVNHVGDEANELGEMPPLSSPVEIFNDGVRGEDRQIHGVLDDVAIIGAALDAEEVTADYEELPWT